MSDQVNKEKTKDAKQEEIPELTDEQLDEAAEGSLHASEPATRQFDASSKDPAKWTHHTG